MKKQRTQNNTSVYAVLGVLNCCLVVMFAFVLYPKPHEVVAAIGPIEPRAVRQSSLPTIRLAKQGIPTRVVVPDVAIDLAVKPGAYEPEYQRWTLDDQAALYADRTVPANSRNGTTLIYGHATEQVFGKIADIKAGVKALVYTDTGLTFTYLYESSRQVLPNDTSALTSGGPPTLILQTCSGIFDTYRTLVTLRLMEVSGYE